MTRPGDRAYRRLLLLLPARLRREAEADLVTLFHAEYARVGSGVWSRARFWCRIVLDTVVTSLAERLGRTAVSVAVHENDDGVERQAHGMNAATRRQRLVHDVRGAVRTLSRAPVFVAGVVLTLALGIGANGAVFSILQAVLLQPLPYERPEEVVMIWRGPAVIPPRPPGTLHARDWRRSLTSNDLQTWDAPLRDVLTDIAPFIGEGNFEAVFDLGLDDRAERLRGMLAAPNFFDVLGARAALGRVWTSADDASPVPLLVLSDRLWRRAFAADPEIVGTSVTLALGRPQVPRTFTVLGVLSQTFRFTYPLDTEAWGLHSWADLATWPRGAVGLRAVGRLKPGVTAESADARLAAFQTESDRADQAPGLREITRVEPVAEWVKGDVRPSLWLLGGVAALLLLITCVTVSGAQFVRIVERRREMAVRAALGASRGQLIRQLLTEGALLTALGTAAGVLLAVLLLPILRAMMPTVIPRGDEIGINAWLLLFAAATVAVVTVLSSLAPAWRGARVELAPALKGGRVASADRVTVRWRQSLLAAQAAIASVLLVAAALLLVSFWRLGQVPLGFDADRVLTVEMRLIDSKYRDLTPTGPLARFQIDLVERLRAVPGIVDVGLTSAVPFRGVDFSMVLTRTSGGDRVGGNGRFVDAGYFRVMGLPVTRGRMFSENDIQSSPKVVMISEAYARAMFGDEDPIGQSIDYREPFTVVGVVGDVRYRSFAEEAYPAIYFARSQRPEPLICIVARTSPGAGDLSAAVRRVVRDLDPAVPTMHMTTIEQILSGSVADRRFFTSATAAFAGVALLLTAVGLSVIIARVVVERQRELAIRSALGATNARLMRLTAWQGLAPVAVGVMAGVAMTATGAHLLDQFLFHVTPRAPWVYIAVASLIGLVGAVACLIPARRVTGASPASLLRAE